MAEPIAEVGYLAGACGHTGDGWQKLGMVWGYYDRWYEDLSFTVTAEITSKNSTPVPDGYVYVAQVVQIRNTTRAATTHQITLLTAAADEAIIAFVTGVDRWFPTVWNGAAPLKKDDYINVGMGEGEVGDSVQAAIWGYKMRLDL